MSEILNVSLAPMQPVIDMEFSPTTLQVSLTPAVTINTGAPSSYVWTQTTPSISWDIPHGQNRFPSVTLADMAGNEVKSDVFYVDANIVRATFAAPFAGKAYIN